MDRRTPSRWRQPSLDALLAAGTHVWSSVRESLTQWLSDESLRGSVQPHLRPRDDDALLLPFTVADYVDFYASEHHATNLGRDASGPASRR